MAEHGPGDVRAGAGGADRSGTGPGGTGPRGTGHGGVRDGADGSPRSSRLDPAVRHGPGRVLVAVYALFALAATARSAVQIGARLDEAPLAYGLSAFAALVYVVATVTLAIGARRVALVACAIELVGVLTVGTLSLADTAAFPDATVWSGYGAGYGFVPLILPPLGLLWLRHTARRRAAE